LGSTVNGAFSLSITSTGTTTFGGVVGGTTPLMTLTVSGAGGTTAINGGAITTTGNQTYNNAVTLGANDTVTTTAGNILFASTLNGAFNLSLNVRGTTTFNGVVGGVTPLNSLTDMAFAVAINANLFVTNNLSLTANQLPDPVGDVNTVTGGAVTVRSLSGNVSIQAADDVTFNSASTIQAAGSVTIVANRNNEPFDGFGFVTVGTIIAGGGSGATLCAAGDLTVGTINAAPVTVGLTSSNGRVIVNGGITATNLGVLAKGTLNLGGFTNQVSGTFAANVGVGVGGSDTSFLDGQGFTVGVVSATGCFLGATGVTAAGSGNITLNNQAGQLTINQVITSATSGIVRLTSGAGIVQNATGVIAAASLGIIANGSVNLNQALNTVTVNFAARNTGPGAAILFQDTAGVSIDSVSADPLFGGVTGVMTNGGAFTLTTGGSLNVDQNINLGSGGLSLTVGGTATFNNPAVVTAASGTLTGSAGNNAVVMNYNTNTTYIISGSNAGTIANNPNLAIPSPGLVFSGFGSLTGGTGSDSFKFVGTGSVTGNINGGGTTPTDTLDYSGYTADVHVNVTGFGSQHGLKGGNSTTGIGGIFDNIDSFVGNSSNPSFNSSLCGPDIPNTWIINGTNSGKLDGFMFSGFNILLGGNSTDAFTFLPGGLITTIDGRGNSLLPTGFDSLSFSSVTTPETVNLTNIGGSHGYAGMSTVGFSGGGSFTNIDKIIGTTTAAIDVNLLQGANRNTGWSITGRNMGNLVDAASGHFLVFVNFPNLTGGNMDDSFTITTPQASGRSLDGQLKGGGGNDTLSFSDLNVPQPGGYYQVGIILNGSDATGFNGIDWNSPNAMFQADQILGKGFSGIRNLNGGWGVGNSLQGDPSTNAIWNANTVPDSNPMFPKGNIGGNFSDGSQMLFFSRFQTLVGGAGASMFNLTSTPTGVTTNLFGNTGNDVFNVGNPIFNAILGPVLIFGQGHLPGNPPPLAASCGAPNPFEQGDQVSFLDSNNGAPTTYTLGAGVFTQTGAAPVYFTDVQTVILKTGTGADTVNIEGTPDHSNTIVTAGTPSNTVINLHNYSDQSGIHLLGGGPGSSTTFNIFLNPANLNSVIQIDGGGGSSTLLFFNPVTGGAGFDTSVFVFKPTGGGNGTVNVIGTGQPVLCFAAINSIPQQAFEASSFLLPTLDSQGRPNFAVSLSSVLAPPISLPVSPFASVLAQASPASPFGFSAPTVTLADVNGDGVPDLIVGLGSGFVPLVTIFDGISLFSTTTAGSSILAQFFAYSTTFAGGVYVAAGNITHNRLGQPDIVTGPGQGGGSVVSVFEYNGSFNANIFPGGGVAPLVSGGFNGSFIAYPNFFGGVRVAMGDTTGSSFDDIITGAGPGGGPHVKVFNGQAMAKGTFDPNTGLRASFFAYDATFTGGVFVAAGVYNPNTNHADILTGAGFGGAPHVKVFDGLDPNSVVASFFAFDLTTSNNGLLGSPAFPGVGSVAFDDSLDNDGFLDIVVGSGPGQPAQMRVFDNINGGQPALSPLLADAFFTFDGQTVQRVTNGASPNILTAAVNVGGVPIPMKGQG
jgi:hypothetical protein